MKRDYDNEFWISLCSDINAYIDEVQSKTPIPQLDQARRKALLISQKQRGSSEIIALGSHLHRECRRF